MSTEATTTDGGTSGTPQRDDASSAAERLGGPSEEQSPDAARRAETGDDRPADTGCRRERAEARFG